MSTKLGTLTLDLVARVSSFTQGMNQASTSAEREMRRVENSVVSASGAIKSLAATAAASFSVAQISNYADEFINLQNRLKLVTGSTQELTQATKDTYAIAQATAGSWDSTVQVYQRFAQNAKTLGINLSQVASLTDTVSKAIAISGGTAASSEAALVQFGQSLSSGVLRGEEFNSIAEQAGGLRDAIARGLNISAGDLRKWAADGKLTTDIVIKALQESKVSVDDLFNKTDFTGAQGFKKLSTASTLYVGELSKSTGASKAMYDSLSYLSENLEKVTSVAAVGAAFMAGTYLPAIYGTVVAGYAKTKQLIDQTAIQYGAINAERAAAASSLIQSEAQLLNTQTTLAALAAEKALELQRLKAQITDQGRMASTTRMAQLRQIEVQVTAELTVAETTLAAARARSTAAVAAGMGVGRGLLGLMMGPVGLGLAVAGVAASYLMLRDSTKDTTSTLDLQKGTVSELVAEYSKLDDLQKRTTMRELEKEVNKLSTAYTVAFSDLNAFIGWLDDSGSVSESTAKEVNRLYKEYRTGGLSASDFATAINGLSGVQVKHKQKIDDLTTAQAKSKTEYEKVKTAQDALTKQTGAAVKANKDEAESIDAKRLAQEKLSALDKSYAQKNLDIDFSRINIKNHGLDMGKALAEFYDENKLSKTQKLSVEQWGIFQKNFSKQQELKNLENDITQDKKDQTKELEKQQKLQAKQAVLLAGNNEQTRNMLRVYQAFRSTGLPDKQSRVMTAQVGRENDFVSDAMFGSHKDRNNGYTNSGFISWQKGRSTQLMQYLQSQGVLDKKGNIEQTQDALDAQARFLVQEISTGKGYGKSKTALANDDLDYRSLEKIIGQNFIGWDYTGKYGLGATKASKHLAKQDNYHSQLSGILGSNPEIVSSSLKDISKIEDEAYKAKAKTEDDIRQLQAQFDTEAIQRSKERDEQINQAAILGQMDLIPKIWERYNKQEELSALQLEMDLNGYKWGEDQKIEYRRDISKLELEISGQYGKAETELRKNGIDALAQYEIKQHELKQAKELLEIQKTWMSASVYASQYYALVRQEILSSNSPESIKDAQLRSSNIDEEENRHATWNQYQNAIGVDTTLQDQLGERNTAIKDALDMQLITQEEHQASMLASEAKYYNAKAAMGLASAGTTMDGLAELTGAMLGEQNFLYKASFAAAKAFAVAKAIMNAPETFSNVYTSISAIPLIGPYIAPVMAGAAVAVQVAQASQIKSMQMSGFADGGYTGHGGKYEIGGVVHKGEGVLTQEEIAKLGGPSGFFALRDSIANGFADGGLVGVPSYAGGSRYLQNNSQTGVSITINNNTNAHVDARQNSDGTVTIDIVDQRIAQSWNKVRRGNSNESQAIQQAFGLSPTR